MQLAHQVALVTGGGSGLGRAMAIGLAREGASVVVADVLGLQAKAVAAEIKDEGHRAIPMKLDVTKKKEVERVFAKAESLLGPLDILVNNVGIWPLSPVSSMKEEDWDRVIDTNLKGVLLCSQAAIRSMVSRRKGRIVNIASGRGIVGSPVGAHYAASKAGVMAFTRSLSLELAEVGINVNAIAPGATDTPAWRAGVPAREREEQLRKTSLAERIGKPEDIVGTLIYLVTEASRYVTGQTFFLKTP